MLKVVVGGRRAVDCRQETEKTSLIMVQWKMFTKTYDDGDRGIHKLLGVLQHCHHDYRSLGARGRAVTVFNTNTLQCYYILPV